MEATTLPVTITPEAAAHVAGLGYQREFEMMLEHTRKFVPGLRSITVELAPPYDTGDEFCVLIEVLTDPPPELPDDPAETEWGNWKIETFSPDVHRHFAMMTV